MNNWVLILVIVVLAGYTITGYTRGFLKIVYSLISWLLMLVFVICAAPQIENYLKNETEIYSKAVVYCEEKIRTQAEEQMASGDKTSILAVMEENELLAALLEKLPQGVIDEFLNQTSETADKLLERYDIYGKMAASMAELVIKGIAFLLALVIGAILSAILVKLIGFISHLPLIGFANSILGLAAGAVNGLLVIWSAFYLVAALSATEFCSKVLSYIYASEFLTVLYEKNILLLILMKN